MSDADPKQAAYNLVFDEAVRQLAATEAAATAARTRGTNVATAATAIAALVGGFALDREPSGRQWFVAMLAAAAYVAALITALHVASPNLARRHLVIRWVCKTCQIDVGAWTAGECHGIRASFLKWAYAEHGLWTGSNATSLVDRIDNQGLTAAAIYSELALDYQRYAHENELEIDGMARSLRRAVLLMVLELAFLLWLLAIVAGNNPSTP